MPETPLEEGVYYQRIARPYSNDHTDSPGWNPEDEEKSNQYEKTKTLAESAGQLHHLKEHLEEICRVIYPCGENNLRAYGHEIRNVLIVACTEVEAQWQGILKANGYKFEKDFASTHDYVELLVPLRLNRYSVRFPYFPAIEPIAPFEGWKKATPTGSLEWYAAYNKAKHDRELNFNQAQLRHALAAAAAYFVMLCAQHGWEIAARPREASTRFFCLKDKPSWEKEHCYTPITRGRERVFNKCKRLFPKANAVEERSPLILAEKPDRQPNLEAGSVVP